MTTNLLSTVKGETDGRFYYLPGYVTPSPRSSLAVRGEAGFWILPQILELAFGLEWIARSFNDPTRVASHPMNPSTPEPTRNVQTLVYFFNTFQFPVLIGFHVLSDLVLQGGAGFEVHPFGLTEEVTRVDTTQDYVHRANDEVGWNWFNLFLQAGARYSIPLTQSFSFTLGAHYRIGLIDQRLIEKDRMRTLDILAGVGVRYRF